MRAKVVLRALAAGAAALSLPAAPALASAGAATAGALADTKAGWDHLWRELMIDITVIGLVFAAVTLYFLVVYRRRRPDDEGGSFRLGTLGAFGWVLIPAFIFMADDIFLAAKNFELWNDYRNVPDDAYVVEVEGSMWSWEVRYPEGAVSDELVVAVGRPVKVKLTSTDVVHSFFIPDLRLKWDMVPGRTTYVWFPAGETGEHVITCAEYCGTLHSGMHTKLRIVPRDEFERFIEENKT
ncbi:MAG TPA: cytochrome c oxidase subunit II [Deltaproteobacteria bacterium]|nr:cytochrome c oxidase subunit II [Deltaproteobacteria bacterium]